MILTWHTEKIRISNEVRVADTFVRRWIARGTHATDHPLAAAFASSTYADTWLRAGNIRRTDVRLALSTRERIAHETFDALASWSAVAHDALRSRAADEAIAFYEQISNLLIENHFKYLIIIYILTRNTFVVFALHESDHASTPSGMLVRFAIGIWPARYVVARVHAPSVHTSENIITVVVGRALVLCDSDSRTTSTVRITHCSLWTLADVVTLGVDAVCTVSAGIVRAFVHIDASMLRISLVASLAHAPWWIAWGTLRVDTTRETITGI